LSGLDRRILPTPAACSTYPETFMNGVSDPDASRTTSKYFGENSFIITTPFSTSANKPDQDRREAEAIVTPPSSRSRSRQLVCRRPSATSWTFRFLPERSQSDNCALWRT
jgi:hypothetical protein